MPTLVEFGHDIVGSTTDRPAATAVDAGCRYFDTTLGQQLVSDGTNWLTANGGIPVARGDGAKNGATVSVSEQGNEAVHKTVLTLTSTPITIVSVTTGNGVGGTKVYDFPEGRILVLGCMADISLAVAAAKQADFTDGTPEGDLGVGSVAPANADALGTDATDDDMGTATAFTMTAFAAANVKIPSEASIQFDGTTTPLDAYLNALVDAADIDDDTTTEIEATGTITLHWINLGDF